MYVNKSVNKAMWDLFQPGLCTFVAVLLSTFFMLGFIFFYNSKNVVNCRNPQCVRCSTYKEVLQRATVRLSHLSRNYMYCADSNTNIDDLKTVKSSLFHSNQSDILYQDSNQQKPEVFCLKGISSEPWWNKSMLDGTQLHDDVQTLELKYDIIWREFKEATNNLSDYSNFCSNETEQGSWSVCYLINQGIEITNNTRLFPKTFSIIKGLKTVMQKTVFGNVMFSCLKPGTIIQEHYGPTNTRLRCHLGLRTPNCCRITVQGVEKTWQEGQCILFDDSYLHCVHHSGSSDQNSRIVLIVDVWHPSISKNIHNIIKDIFSPLIKE